MREGGAKLLSLADVDAGMKENGSLNVDKMYDDQYVEEGGMGMSEDFVRLTISDDGGRGRG